MRKELKGSVIVDKHNLHKIFQKYIDKFEYINNDKNNENYKWEIAHEFQSFDLNAKDFVAELTRLSRIASNLFDSVGSTPFAALIAFAKNEPETVRKMFIDLYEEDKDDLTVRQRKIDNFIDSSEKLRIKYFPDSFLYKNDQRSAMQFLFLRYPDQNYAYKAMQAKSFADCIGFFDDWGSMSNFKIDVYYRLCNQLVEEIKLYPALVETSLSRFENPKKPMYPDKEFHILAFDIIYCSQVYAFYDGMEIEPITAKARKLHEERVNKAHELLSEYLDAEEKYEALIEAKNYISEKFGVGIKIKHKSFGEGTIVDINNNLTLVQFEKNNEVKKLAISALLINNLIIIEDEETKEKVNLYKDILRKENDIPRSLSQAKEKLVPYQEYLD